MQATLTDQRGIRILTHSASGYTRGCRCDECKRARSAADKDRRGPARRQYPLRVRLLSQLIVDMESGCVLWTGPVNKDGYGVISARGRMRLVHRVMWEVFEEPIPDGIVLDHVRTRGCTNRHCASIAHLEPVTQLVNLLRATTFATLNAAKDRCPADHPYSDTNTYYGPGGGRRCRTCHRDQGRAKRKAARGG